MLQTGAYIGYVAIRAIIRYHSCPPFFPIQAPLFQCNLVSLYIQYSLQQRVFRLAQQASSSRTHVHSSQSTQRSPRLSTINKLQQQPKAGMTAREAPPLGVPPANKGPFCCCERDAYKRQQPANQPTPVLSACVVVQPQPWLQAECQRSLAFEFPAPNAAPEGCNPVANQLLLLHGTTSYQVTFIGSY